AIDGEPVPGYTDELGHDSKTETFVALKAHIDNWRWKGVPFYLRTGKRMPQRDSEIFIQFKDVPYSIFASRGATTRPNKLSIGRDRAYRARRHQLARVDCDRWPSTPQSRTSPIGSSNGRSRPAAAISS